MEDQSQFLSEIKIKIMLMNGPVRKIATKSDRMKYLPEEIEKILVELKNQRNNIAFHRKRNRFLG